jgi:hypothetical protein
MRIAGVVAKLCRSANYFPGKSLPRTGLPTLLLATMPDSNYRGVLARWIAAIHAFES